MQKFYRVLTIYLCFCMMVTSVPVSAVTDVAEEYMSGSSSSVVSEQQDASQPSDERIASDG